MRRRGAAGKRLDQLRWHLTDPFTASDPPLCSTYPYEHSNPSEGTLTSMGICPICFSHTGKWLTPNRSVVGGDK